MQQVRRIDSNNKTIPPVKAPADVSIGTVRK
jgi:hypothetical protein